MKRRLRKLSTQPARSREHRARSKEKNRHYYGVLISDYTLDTPCSVLYALGLELDIMELAEAAVEFQQVFLAAGFQDSPALQHIDSVCLSDGA